MIWFLQVYKIPSYHNIFNQYLIFKKFPTNSIVQPLCLGWTNSSYRLDDSRCDMHMLSILIITAV